MVAVGSTESQQQSGAVVVPVAVRVVPSGQPMWATAAIVLTADGPKVAVVGLASGGLVCGASTRPTACSPLAPQSLCPLPP